MEVALASGRIAWPGMGHAPAPTDVAMGSVQALADRFRGSGVAEAPGLLPEPLRLEMSSWYHRIVDLGIPVDGDPQDHWRWAFNSDPVGRLLNVALTPLASAIAGEDLRPSYSYFAGYRSQSELPVHRDRDACHFTIGLVIDGCGHDWPLKVATPTGTEHCLKKPGDVAAFAGTRLDHWRERENHWNWVLTLHYVAADGDR